MRTRLVALVVALLFVGTAAFAQPATGCPPPAQVPTGEQARVGLRDARDHGFLWRLRKGGRNAYLYGTLHVARPEWMYPGPTIAQALDASDTVAVELDLLDPDIVRRLSEGMLAQAGSAAVPVELRQRLEGRLAEECLPAQALASMSAELQVITLMTLVGRRDGLDPSYGIDLFLSAWSHGQKKTVVSLETPELQLKALQSSTPEEPAEFVRSSLDELDSGRARSLVLRLSQAWADGDIAELESYERWCDCLKTDADRAAMARLLDERNPGLAESIDALHGRGQRVFAAVGSLHMTGRNSLQALMAQRGFTVERIPLRR